MYVSFPVSFPPMFAASPKKTSVFDSMRHSFHTGQTGGIHICHQHPATCKAKAARREVATVADALSMSHANEMDTVGTRWAPTSYKRSYGAPINGLING